VAEANPAQTVAVTASPTGVVPATRLLSLDIFRGATMAAMVIVNNPGDWGNVYAPLLHAEWNGWTPTDLIFPFFLFIVGVSLTLSRSTLGSWTRIVRRSAVIFLVGVLLTGIPRFPFATWRIPGVLQRIAVCYLAAATLFRLTRRDGRTVIRQAVTLGAWAAFFTLAYWALISWVPAPGGVAGDLSPNGNLGAFIDRTVFGASHLWQRRLWDPEGIFSTVPAIGTALLGCVAGLCVGSNASRPRKAAMLAGGGVVLVLVGLLWNQVFPINKNLWTSSYVAFTAGAASLCLAACYFVLDVLGWRKWAKPFEILGLNAITLFVLSALLAKLLIYVRWTTANGRASLGDFLYSRFYEPLAPPKNASLLFALTHLAVLFILLYVMYRKRIFLKA
jgi:predicted acyltransferase